MSERGKYGEPWSFDGMGNLIDCHGERIATGYDNGETCIDHDDRVRVCINTCAPLGEDPAAEIAAKDARIAELESALAASKAREGEAVEALDFYGREINWIIGSLSEDETLIERDGGGKARETITRLKERQ